MSVDEQGAEPEPGPDEGGAPTKGSGLGGMEAAARAGTTPGTAAAAADRPQVDVEAAEAGQGGPAADDAEARVEELADLSSMQADPGEGVVDAEPGSASEKQGSSGASKGTGPLGVADLDQGATGQVTGSAGAAADEQERRGG